MHTSPSLTIIPKAPLLFPSQFSSHFPQNWMCTVLNATSKHDPVQPANCAGYSSSKNTSRYTTASLENCHSSWVRESSPEILKHLQCLWTRLAIMSLSIMSWRFSSLKFNSSCKKHLPAIQGAWHRHFTPVLFPAAFAKEIHVSHTHNFQENSKKSPSPAPQIARLGRKQRSASHQCVKLNQGNLRQEEEKRQYHQRPIPGREMLLVSWSVWVCWNDVWLGGEGMCAHTCTQTSAPSLELD